MVTLNEACTRTLELFVKRPGAGNWADNITEGSRGLRDEDYENYIRFLACPLRLQQNHPPVECSECDESKMLQEYESAHLEEHMKVEMTKNGTDTFVHVRNTEFSRDDQKEDDEKAP